ncbi:MAG: PDZ domain-containing protein [Xanthomonadaceae bacterium]|nr:PDZ domain-containing protein [Rhodospirillaceae bacterium]NIA17604.1 PDZ domain-containing protein [Xanthomonadaceae bacterium]
MFKKFQNLFFVLLLTAIGFISGILGALYIENNLLELNTVYDKYIQTNNVYQKKELIFSNNNKINFSIDYFRRNIVGIIKRKKGTANLLNNFYSQKDIIGYGFVLTDDGWIIVLDDNINKEKNSDLAIINNNQIFYFQKKVLDPCTGILFLKVETKGKKLSTIKLGDSDKIKLLDDLMSVDLFGNAFEGKIINTGSLKNFIQSSEKLDKRIIIDKSVNLGLPFVNQYGEIIGIVSQKNKNYSELIPVNYFKNKINNVLMADGLKRIFLGVNYIDSSEFFYSNKITDGNEPLKGDLIYALQKSEAIKSKSPAEKAGLKYNDLILSVEDEDLGINKSLNEIIQEYKIGSEIELKILRKGKIKKIKVVLDEL